MNSTKPGIVFLLIILGGAVLFGMQLADAEFLHPTESAVKADSLRRQAAAQQTLDSIAIAQAQAQAETLRQQATVAATQARAQADAALAQTEAARLSSIFNAATEIVRQRALAEVKVRQAMAVADVELDQQRQQARSEVDALAQRLQLLNVLMVILELGVILIMVEIAVMLAVATAQRVKGTNTAIALAIDDDKPRSADAWQDTEYRRWRIQQARRNEQSTRAVGKVGYPVWVVAAALEDRPIMTK